MVCGIVLSGNVVNADAPYCSEIDIRFTDDNAYVVGCADYESVHDTRPSYSSYRWKVNDSIVMDSGVSETFFLHLDNELVGAAGEQPLVITALTFVEGKWNGALALDAAGLSYAATDNYSPTEGTIEMWIAPRADGNDPIYQSDHHTLFSYDTPEGDYMFILQDGSSGVIYAGGSVNGQWQSAYTPDLRITDWSANEWHYLVVTYSASGNYIRLYVDGELVADTNEGRYNAPSATGEEIFVGSSRYGQKAHYLIDECRLYNQPLSESEILARALRTVAPQENEVWSSTAALSAGDTVVFEFIPYDGVETGPIVSSDSLIYRPYEGDPLFNANPPSTLLKPYSTEVDLSVSTASGAECRYSLNEVLPYEQMIPFTTGNGSTKHLTTITGLNPDPNYVNDVYVRCSTHPDFVLELKYRVLSDANPTYPKTGNLWGWGSFYDKSMEHCSKIDLWMGVPFSPDQIRELRTLNPNIRVLWWINAIEFHEGQCPDDYFLKDVNGNKILNWVDAYRVNVTRPEVAEYMAKEAARFIIEHDMMYDGIFFDNVQFTQAWYNRDMYGNYVQIDANEDGIPDDPAELDAAWEAGLRYEFEVFRRLMPNAIVMSHCTYQDLEGVPELFDGISIGYTTAGVIEGREGFGDLCDMNTAWSTRSRQPSMNMVESAPPNQIAYGYGYEPWKEVPASTLEFAEHYYPYMRFGLAYSLLMDDFFAHEFGDTWHGNDWWYDELDFDLGFPVGDAEEVAETGSVEDSIIINGGFESAIAYPWNFYSESSAGCDADITWDQTDSAEGGASAKVTIRAISGNDWQIDFAHMQNSIVEGTEYRVEFWAKSDHERAMTLYSLKGSPDWSNFGLYRRIDLTTEWTHYQVTFKATGSANDVRIQFVLGEETGTIWLDDVKVYPFEQSVLCRKFANGMVYLNPSCEERTITVDGGYKRLSGTQAAKYQYIIDDDSAAFSAEGNWMETEFDSGEWKAVGPFYHDWGAGCHGTADSGATATWMLDVREVDTYTIKTWWPAAPDAVSWSAAVVYEVIANGQIVASTVMDQTDGGDEWHAIGTVYLTPGDDAYVRIRNSTANPFIADAVYVESALRYNNGEAVTTITLQPMDGIVLAVDNEFDRQSGPDTDVDGMPDQWEQYYLGGTIDHGADDDYDGDGYTNFEEFIADTNPSDPDSRFLLNASIGGSGEDVLLFDTSALRTYKVQFASDLFSEIWTEWQTLNGTGDEISLTNLPSADKQRFYRVAVQKP